MEYFESIIKTLLESEGYWVRQSFKVNLTKEEKRKVGKHSIPRPEIDLLAFKAEVNEIIAIEAKSFLDSPGVHYEDLSKEYKIQQGKYKLFTCRNYREVVLNRLKKDLLEQGMCSQNTRIKLGLVAGNVYRLKAPEIKSYFKEKGWFFWSPEDVKEKVCLLAKKGYENEPSIITAKILMRN